ncbi:MAG: SAF domain-containing protein [Bifidobacterium sp.]|nr:SAF domain-containing protein [Bifidobacterium sp.]
MTGFLDKFHGLFQGLEGRRRERRWRRMGAAALAGVAVWCGLQCVLSAVRTRPALVAAHALERGDVLTSDDVSVTRVTDHAALAHAPADPLEVQDKVALVPIADGELLLPSMVDGAPVVPEGYTVIDVRLGKLQHAFEPGTRVELTTVIGCPTDDGEICTVSADAVVMGEATHDGLVAVAMPGADAMRALEVQVEAPLIAVRGP